MNTGRHARQKELFLAALELPAAERLAMLQRECGDDAALLRELREMLAVEDCAPSFLAPTAAGPALFAATAATELPGRLGPFRPGRSHPGRSHPSRPGTVPWPARPPRPARR